MSETEQPEREVEGREDEKGDEDEEKKYKSKTKLSLLARAVSANLFFRLAG